MPRFAWGSRRAATAAVRTIKAWSTLALAVSATSILVAPLVVQAEPNAPSVHVVQDGDTLLQIALDAGVDVPSIVSLNGLSDENVLAIGQSVKLPPRGNTSASSGSPSTSSSTAAPSSTSAAPAASSPSSGSYSVAQGDTLWDIAQKFGTTSDALVQLNHLDDPDHLALGTVLRVPTGKPQAATTAGIQSSGSASAGGASASSPAATSSATGAASAGAAAAPSGNAASSANASAPSSASRRDVLVSYTVQPGETLSQIARQFGVRSDAIVQASSLDDANKLSVGSVLKVPVPAREHVVTDGETLRDIAASEKVDLGSLIDFNHIDDPELIRVGQVVVLPTAANQQAASTATAAAAPARGSAPAAPAPAASTADQAAAADGQTAATPAPTPSPAQPTASAPAQAAAAQPAAQSNGGAGSSKPTVQAKPAAPAGAAPAQKPAASPPKPAAPVAVVAPPPGAPTDGLAGAALKFLGSPYIWGGSNPGGFDCSGLVWYVAKQLGRPLTRGMFGQFNSGSHPSRDDLKVGDLVFFQNTFAPGLSHNGIYIGNGQFVHAADEAAGVTISSLSTAYWSSHWFGATRLP